MSKLRLYVAGALAVAGAILFVSLKQRPVHDAAGAAERTGGAVPGLVSSAAPSAPSAPDAASRGPETEMGKFSAWAERYARADAAQRALMTAEGVELALARRPEMLRLIKDDPERALREAVPYALRRHLPAEVQALIEQPVNAEGVYTVKVFCDPEHKHEGPLPPPERQFKTDGQRYTAHVYGWRAEQFSKSSVALNGVALDGQFAVSTDSVRLLDAVEAADVRASGRAAGLDSCSMCGDASGFLSLVELSAGEYAAVNPEHVALMNDAIQHGLTSQCGAGCAVHSQLTADGGTMQEKMLKLLRGINPPMAYGSVSGSTNPPTPVTGRIGQRTLLLIPAQFGDEVSPPVTRDQAENAGRQVGDQFNRMSFGFQQVVTTVTPAVILPQRLHVYDEQGDGRIINDAEAEAMRLGYNPNQFDYVYVVTRSFPSANFGGISSGLAFGVGVGLLVHEIGHNNGLGHANNFDNSRPNNPAQPNPALPFDTDSQVGHPDLNGPYVNTLGSPVTGGSGSVEEYGDNWDTMGSGGSDFSASMKSAIGWLPSPFVRVPTGSETNRLHAFDQGTVVSGRTYLINVPRRLAPTGAPGPDQFYRLSHRRAINNNFLRNGVLVQSGTTTSLLLDTTSGSPGERDDAPIVLGRTFTDPEAELHITPTAVGGTGADSFIDVVIQRGSFPGNNPPVISSLNASALTIPVGGSVDFSVDAADPDGDMLAYHFSYSDGDFGDNQPTHTRTFNTAGSYVVTCEVSDMKGGVDSTHLVVRVGAFTTFNISGRVTDNNGLPVRGVRVHNGVSPVTAAGYRHALTDARGFYTIPNLAPGTYEISGFSYRHRTEPLNYNNGTITLLGADVADVNLLANEITRVSVAVLSGAVEPSTGGVFRISRTGFPTNDLAVRFNVQSTTGAGFSASTGSPVTIPAGQSFVDVTITPSDDGDGDGGKDVTLTLLNQTNYTEVVSTIISNVVVMQTNNFVIPGWERRPRRTDNAVAWFQTQAQYVIGNATAVMQVADDDAPGLPGVSIVRANVGVVEGSRNIAAFVVTRTLTPLTAPLTVNLNLAGGATNGLDYVAVPPSVTIPAGERFATVPIIPINNYLVESNRTVVASIAANPGVYTVSATGVNLRTITIVDDDLPAVAVISPDSVANRSGNNGRFTLVRSGDLTQPLTVNYLVTGSAVPGLDYQPLSGSAVIAAGQSFVDVNVMATPAPSSPGAKLVVLTVSDSAAYNIRASGEATVRIADLVPTVTITSAGTTATIARTGATTDPLTVFYTVGGTANVNTDYASIGASVVIPAGAANVAVPIQTVADNAREFTANGQNNDRLNEGETIEIALLTNPAYEVGNPSRTVITIIDADGGQFPQVGFLSSMTVAREDVGSLSIPVRIAGNPTNGPAQPVLINWSVTGGTAMQGVNYGGPLSGQFQFISNAVPNMGFYRNTSQIQYLGIPILDDGVITGDRTLILTLGYHTAFVTNTNGIISIYPTNAVIGEFTTHTVTLKDVNRATVSISTVTNLAYEQGTVPGVFRLTRTGSTAQPLAVNVFADGTAAPGADYVKIPAQVVIPAGTNAVNVMVTPNDDTPQEQAETVVLRLVETPGITFSGPTSRTVVIVDNDGTIQFTSTSVTVDEGAGNAVVEVLRTGNTNVMASVDYLLTPGTATEGPDYTGTGGTLFFGIGQTVAQITIPILDDNLVEGAETVLISLLNASGGAPIAGQTDVTLIINDNDSAVDFLSATFSEYEDGTNALITIRRTGLTNGAISVDFATMDGTADSSDYTPVMTTVNFAPGVTTQVVALPLLNDAAFEGDETVLLSLTNVVGGVLGANAAATLTIVEDEAVIEFAAAAQAVIEHAGVATVEVRRLGGTRHPFTVDLAVMNGTATNGLDFQQSAAALAFSGDAIATLTNGSGQMVFAPGESSKVVNVTLLDDMLGEGDETFQLSLMNLVPPGGLLAGTVQLGAQTTNTITLLDDEQPGFVDFFYTPVLADNGSLGVGGPTASVTGTVTDATTGLGVGGVAITMGMASTMSASDGSYTIPNAPVGMTPINASLPGFFAFSDMVDVMAVPSNLYNFSMSPALLGDAIRLVLTWGADPADLDSFLETPVIGGVPHLISFFNQGSLTAPPFALLDVDDVTGFGPETITITNRFPGTYNYYINRFSGVGTISSNSNARVEVYDATGLLTTINVPTNGGSGDFWHVLQIDGGSGSLTVINTITTNAPAIQTNLPPSILRPPMDIVTDEGATVTFDVLAGGASPFSYQWQMGMADLPGETNAALQLANVLTNDSGAYRVVVSNAFGSITSTVAQLTVNLGCERGITGGFVNALGLFAAENKVVVGGTFTTVSGFSVPGIARLTSSGLLDSFFNPGTGANGAVTALAVAPDGRVYLGGDFTGVAGNPAAGLARLAVNGSFDPGFNAGAGPGGAVHALALQSDGKLLVAGDFTNYVGQAGFSYVVRLNTNGTLDTNFTAMVDAKVLALAVQPDGAILIGGCFDMAGGASRARIARLLPTGALDGTFNPGIGADGAVRAIALQSTGNILIGGALRIYNGVPVGRFARLLPDGTLDGSFVAGAGADAPVNAIAVDARDKILLGGAFSTVDGQSSRGFARLRSTGAVDGIFKPGTGANGPVFAALAQADSSLIIGGDFTDVQGVPRTGLARIHGDAKSVAVEVLLSAAQFTVGEADGMVSVGVERFGNTNVALALQLATLDGTALAGTDYTGGPYAVMFGAGDSLVTVDIPIADNLTIEGTRQFTLVLTNAPVAVILSDPSSATVTILDDESAVRFTTTAQSVAEGAVAVITVERLGLTNAPASVEINVTGGSATPGADFTFTNVTVNFLPGDTMRSVMLAALEDMMADGPDTVELTLQNPTNVTVQMPDVHTVTINDFVPLPGMLDPQFNPSAPGTDTLVRSLAVQPDGKLLIGGTFSNYNGTPRVHLARLGTNGTLDAGFDPAAGPDGLVTSIGVLADDKIAIAGSFLNVNGSMANRAARLQPGGGKDFNFNAPGTLDSAPGALAVQPDGRVLIGGAFSMPAPRLTRLSTTGSKDGGFATGTGIDGVVHAIARDEAGNVYIGGGFSMVDGQPRQRIARLLPGGALDTNFVPVAVTGGLVQAIAVQPDGGVLLAGSFTDVGGVARGRVARLLPGGALDAGFDPGAGVGGTVFSLALQPNGRVVLAGDFTSVGGVPCGRVARLEPTGALDMTFNPGGAGADATVFGIAVRPDGRIALGGSFSTFNGAARRGVALLFGDGPYTRFERHVVTPTEFRATLATQVGTRYVFEASTDLVMWQALATNQAFGSTLTFVDADVAANPNRSYRARVLVP